MNRTVLEVSTRVYLGSTDNYAEKTSEYVTLLRSLYPQYGGLSWSVEPILNVEDKILDVLVTVKKPKRIPNHIRWALFRVFVLIMVLIYCVTLMFE